MWKDQAEAFSFDLDDWDIIIIMLHCVHQTIFVTF